MTSQPAIEVRSVCRSYHGRRVVEDASLSLYGSRITCLLGPSGGGKSTLLRLIAGLEDVDAGEILRHGDTVSRPGFTLASERREMGLVFQDLALFPHLTAEQNIAFGIRSMPRAMQRQKVHALLEQFRLSHRAQAYPHMLSGGEQQRIALARALAREPVAVLLDEPFSGLDGRLRQEVRDAVIAGLRKAGAAAMLVTHDPEEAMLVGDDLVLMAEGRVLQTGSPEACYLRPCSLAAARLLGEAFAIEAVVRDGVAVSVFGEIPAPDLPDGDAELLLRPESFRLDDAGKAVQVTGRHFAGAVWEVVLDFQKQPVKARLETQPPDDTTICLSLRADRVHVVSRAK
jgi:iron(III) transport system ATP-binding protein